MAKNTMITVGPASPSMLRDGRVDAFALAPRFSLAEQVPGSVITDGAFYRSASR